MSLEAALDQERREVMELLEGKSNQAGSPSAKRDGNASPVPAVRSMLNVSTEKAPRHGSIAGIGVGITPPPPRSSVRSLLDPQSAPPTNPTHSTSASPTSPQHPSRNRQRSSSDATSAMAKVNERQGDNIGSDYQFDMLPSIANQALPKRVGQAGRIGEFSSSAMSAAMSGDLNSLPSLNPSLGARTSRSPSAKVGRSSSPTATMLGAQPYMPTSTQGRYVTDSGKVIDMGKAYKRLSDAALLKSGGSLSEATRKNSSRNRGSSVDSGSPAEDVRLEKDSPNEFDSREPSIDSSEDDDDEEISSDEDLQSEASRGRRRRRRKGSTGPDSEFSGSDADKKGGTTIGMGRAKGERRKAQSLLAAAEEESKVFFLIGPLH